MDSRIKVSIRTVEPNLNLTTAFNVVYELLKKVEFDFTQINKHSFITLANKQFVITRRDKNLNTRFDVSLGYKL